MENDLLRNDVGLACIYKTFLNFLVPFVDLFVGVMRVLIQTNIRNYVNNVCRLDFSRTNEQSTNGDQSVRGDLYVVTTRRSVSQKTKISR